MKTSMGQRPMRTCLIALCGIAVLTVLAACSSSGSGSPSNAGGANNSSGANKPSGAGTGNKKLTVGLASEGLNAGFPVAIANGVKAVANSDGIKPIVLDGKLTETTQESDIQTLIAEHVNGIIIDPIDPGPTASMVKKIQAANIPVMLVHGYAGSSAKPVYPGINFEIDENETHAGVEAGQMALKAAPSGGQAAIITGTPGYIAVTERADGFKSAVGSKFQVVATQPGNWTTTGGYNACSSILQAHPSIALFYTESDDMAIGCAKAEKAANSHAPIVSIGGERVVKSLISNGTVYGTVCYEPETEGKTVMQAMAKQLRGEASYHQKLDFYSTPIVTKANMNNCGWQW